MDGSLFELVFSYLFFICYKSVQRFRVTCLFTGQYDTGEYGTIAGVIFILSPLVTLKLEHWY